MCSSTTQNTVETIDQLASKSNEFASYSAVEMAQLCDEMLANFQSRKEEWSEAGNWRLEEAKVFELFSDKSGPPSTTEHIARQIAIARQGISATTSSFLHSCKQSYEYEAGVLKKRPEFLEKERKVTMGDGSGKSYSIYGPFTVAPPLPLTFELYTVPTTEEGKEQEEEQKGQNCTKKNNTISKPVTVVLGAGNQAPLTLFDVLQRTMVHREVVLTKHHALRPHLITPYSILLEPLIKRGFVAQVLDQGIPETTKILSHPSIGHVHITGSLATDKAVRATLAKSKPHLAQEEIDSMVSSELGAATPFILANGLYTDKEITHAARNIVASKKFNGGCNCLDAQVIVLPKVWAQKGQFREALYTELRRQPNEPSYYPGSRERAIKMVEVYAALGKDRVKKVECTETKGAVNNPGDHITVVECGSPNDPDFEGSAMRNEAFGPVLAIVELESDESNTEDYLNSVAIPYVNNKENIFGSLSCAILAPRTFDAKKLDIAVESLQYGSIGVNVLALFGWLGATKGAVWCAHPSAPGRESGAGYCGNQFRVSRPAKTVIRGQTLADNPPIDGGNLPPPLLIDALYLMDCSKTVFTGMCRIFSFFAISLATKVFSLFMPSVGKIKFE